MKKSKKKSVKKTGKSSRALNEVKEMVEDLREAGMIFSDVARHFHHRVSHAARVLSGGHKKKAKNKARHAKKKKHAHRKKR